MSTGIRYKRESGSSVLATRGVSFFGILLQCCFCLLSVSGLTIRNPQVSLVKASAIDKDTVQLTFSTNITTEALLSSMTSNGPNLLKADVATDKAATDKAVTDKAVTDKASTDKAAAVSDKVDAVPSKLNEASPANTAAPSESASVSQTGSVAEVSRPASPQAETKVIAESGEAAKSKTAEAATPDTPALKSDTSAVKVDASSVKVDTSSVKVDTSSVKVDTPATKSDTPTVTVDKPVAKSEVPLTAVEVRVTASSEIKSSAITKTSPESEHAAPMSEHASSAPAADEATAPSKPLVLVEDHKKRASKDQPQAASNSSDGPGSQQEAKKAADTVSKTDGASSDKGPPKAESNPVSVAETIPFQILATSP